MPGEIGGIGQHPYRILVDMRLSTGYLDDNLPSGRVPYPPVRSAGLRIEHGHYYLVKMVNHLLHGGESGEYPAHHLHVGNSAHFGRIVLRILAVTGEEEKSGGQPLFIEPLQHELVHIGRHPHISVLSSEYQTIASICRQGHMPVSPRDNHVAAVQVRTAPLRRPGQHETAVLGRERNARTGIKV